MKQRRQHNYYLIFIVELVILALGLVILAVIYQEKNGKDVIIKKYLSALDNHNYSAMYDVMSFEGGGNLVSKKAFVTAKTIQEGDGKNSSANIEIIKKKSVSSDQIEVKDDDDETEGIFYDVTYKNSKGEKVKKRINLVSSGFGWKINGDDEQVENYSFSVPADAEILFDGLKVSDGLILDTEAEDYYTYTLPYVFGATHMIQLSGTDYATSTEKITWNEDDDSLKIMTSYSKSVRKKVSKQAIEDFNSITESAADDAAYDDMEIFKTVNEDMKDLSKSNYDMYRQMCVQGGGVNTKYKLTYRSAKACECPGTSGPVISVKLSAKSKSTYDELNQSTYQTESKNKTADLTAELWYEKVDGKWQLYCFDMIKQESD